MIRHICSFCTLWCHTVTLYWTCHLCVYFPKYLKVLNSWQVGKMLTCGLYESSQSTVVFPPIHFLLFIQFRVAFELEPIPGAHLNFTRYLDGWMDNLYRYTCTFPWTGYNFFLARSLNLSCCKKCLSAVLALPVDATSGL